MEKLVPLKKEREDWKVSQLRRADLARKDREIGFTPSTGMEFELIPAGEFEMGSPSNEAGRFSDEGPVHHVAIENAFYMGSSEVTQQQWRALMGYNPSYFTGDDLPVEQVSWTTCRNSSGSSTKRWARIRTGCPRKRNGNTPAARAPPHAIRSAIRTRNSASMRGILIIQAVRRIRSARRSPIPGGSMICTGMSGNGCRTPAMRTTMAHQPMAAHGKEDLASEGSFGSIGVVAGAASPGAAGQRIAAPARATASSASAFAWRGQYR